MAGSLEEAREWLLRAEDALKAAMSLNANGFYNESVSRSYYAMFYAAKAAVTNEGVTGRKHSTVIAAFGRLFAKSGRVEPRLHRALINAFREREKADYLLGSTVSEQEAKEGLDAAREFIQAATASLSL